jgi:GNAT superfamily N-acetyltransferase
MTIRELTPSDRASFFQLSKVVVEALENKDFLIPMTEEEADATFRDDSKDIVLGAFIDNRLVATLGLFHDIRDYEEVLPVNCHSLKGAEIGEAMVSPELRRSGLMNKLWASLKAIIRKRDLDFLLATAHPDNISNHLMQRDNFILHKVFERRGYTRNMYFRRNKE